MIQLVGGFAEVAHIKKEPRGALFNSRIGLLLWLDFVAAKVLLGLYEKHVLAQLRAVFAQGKLLSGVLSVLAGVINALTRLFTHESD